VVVFVEDRETVVLRVPVGSIWDGRQRRKVVQPVQRGLVGDGVDTAEEEVDIVGFAGAERRGEFTANKVCDGRGREVDVVPHGVELGIGLDVFCELDWRRESQRGSVFAKRVPILVSPASPEKAMRVCWFNALVLSSDALRIVAPLIAAWEAAMMVKSLPVIPSKTSLMDTAR